MRSFQIFACTTTGSVRQANEDHILVGRFIKNSGGLGMYVEHNDDFLIRYGLLFAVADGIGGEAGGATASRLALIALERQFYGVEKICHENQPYLEALQAAAVRANDTILRGASTNPTFNRMGCTLSGVCLTQGGYLVFNAGDSRVYRYRDGFLKLLTNDDTVTNAAIRAGRMSYEEAKNSDVRHTLTNSLGTASFQLKIRVEPEMRDNDLILVCSDGLHDMVDHDQIEKLLGNSGALEVLSDRLVYEAIRNGGYDNISVILVRLDVSQYTVGWHHQEAAYGPSPDASPREIFSPPSSEPKQSEPQAGGHTGALNNHSGLRENASV